MNKQNYDLAVAYRIYPKVSGNPPIFKNDKRKLAESCLKSFKNCLGNLKVKLWVILDNCPPDYENIFRENFDESDLEIIRLNGVGNMATFLLQLDILLNQNYSEIVYFAEDDYYYLPNQFEKMISFLQNYREADFITPYDHLDHYTTFFHRYKSNIKSFKGKHWRTIHSTCCTFLTKKSTLKQTEKVFKIYSKETILLTTWICLTKYKVFNFSEIAKLWFKNRTFFIFYYKAWRYGWKQIILGKRWKLWCPIPTIATHMETLCLAPIIDWETVFKEEVHRFSR